MKNKGFDSKKWVIFSVNGKVGIFKFKIFSLCLLVEKISIFSF